MFACAGFTLVTAFSRVSSLQIQSFVVLNLHFIGTSFNLPPPPPSRPAWNAVFGLHHRLPQPAIQISLLNLSTSRISCVVTLALFTLSSRCKSNLLDVYVPPIDRLPLLQSRLGPSCHQGRRHTFLAGGGDAFQRSLSGRINGMTCFLWHWYVRELASFDLISPRQSKNCDET